jgi:adenylyl cyclase-associated protein
MDLPANGIHNFSTVLKRLEAATTRLENIAASIAPAPTFNQPSISTNSNPVPSKPESIQDWALSQTQIKDFDVILDVTLKKWIKLSNEIGGLVAQQVCPEN